MHLFINKHQLNVVSHSVFHQSPYEGRICNHTLDRGVDYSSFWVQEKQANEATKSILRVNGLNAT